MPPSGPSEAPGPDPPSAPREQLGKYELLRRLATGGMAEIYLAKVKGLEGFEKIVVVKRILPQLATNPEFVQMFLDEARIAATLHHSNVVQVYDIGSVGGSFFFSMEFLHGEDVRTITKRARTLSRDLQFQHAIAIIQGVCSGIHYAHEKVGFDGRPLNIVHRDITPQNVFVTYDGGVKVVDFGIAKASNRYSETRYGTLKGKIPYMSPEQCRSDTLDRRSDVFSIAIMLYELTTGVKLYQGNSEFEILKTIVEQDAPPPSFHKPEYPPELERIVLKGLARDRDKRYQSAQELEIDLDDFAREQRLKTSPIALTRFMEDLFGHKIEAWREAQKEGKQLVDHLVEAAPFEDSGLLEEDEPQTAASSPAGARERSRSRSTPRPRPTRSTQPIAGASGVEVDDLDLQVGEQPSSGRRRGLVLVGIAGLLVVAGVAVESLHRSGTPAIPPPAIPTAAVATSGEIIVVSEPAGARIKVAGAAQAQPAPVTVRSLPLGQPLHIVATLAGYQPWQGDVVLTADTPRLPVTIELLPASKQLGVLQVAVHPDGLHPTFILDGTPAPSATIPSVEKGSSHTLIVQAAGFQDAVLPITLAAADSMKTVVVTLVPLPASATHGGSPRAGSSHGSATGAGSSAAPGAQGEISIDSDPWATVIVDGRPLGPTPQLHVKLAAGRHMVRVSNPQFDIDESQEVTVPAGGAVKKRFTFPAH